MSTTNIITTALGFAGSAGATVTAFLKSVKRFEANLEDMVDGIHAEIRNVSRQAAFLSRDLEAMKNTAVQATKAPVAEKPATKPAAKKAAPVKKPAAKKPVR